MRTPSVELRSPLASEIKAFLAHKRALGKRLEKGELMLRQLDRYLIEQRVRALRDITPGILDGFLATRHRPCPQSYNALLGTVRALFDWLVTHEKLGQSPLQAEPRRATTEPRPFLFNPEQARRLLDAAARLPDNPRGPRRGEVYRMIFVLLYGLGLRVGEVSRLCHKDIDLTRNLLVIRQTKFGKHRLVPFGPRMAEEIRDYLRRNGARSGGVAPDRPVFSFAKDGQKPVYPNTISTTFHGLLPELNLTVPAGVSTPHLHCLRHSFAVGVLLRWYRAGIDPAARLLHLSTFLGHVSPSSTAIYLTITTELLDLASQRFARFAAPALKEILL
jgi:integrase